MLPPGLAFLSVSAKAWQVIEKNPSPRTFYFDLKKAKSKLADSDTPYTQARTLGARGLSYRGMDSTYAAAIAIARRILRQEEALPARSMG